MGVNSAEFVLFMCACHEAIEIGCSVYLYSDDQVHMYLFGFLTVNRINGGSRQAELLPIHFAFSLRTQRFVL